MGEKRKAHYSLTEIKATFSTVKALRMTYTASQCALELNITLATIVTIIQGMTSGQLYKSMTSHADATIWQDVYRVPYGALTLYVKFTVDWQGYLLISFKER